MHAQPTENVQETKIKVPLIISYKIGGHTYFGINSEFRITKLIGVHAGIGLNGYTAGINYT